ncbi:MAG: hypothetical protein JXB36_16750 [Gammaproteobacteria bacterium]|nr:hypothetical protein [Gammaproteobacteria bacterium]
MVFLAGPVSRFALVAAALSLAGCIFVPREQDWRPEDAAPAEQPPPVEEPPPAEPAAAAEPPPAPPARPRPAPAPPPPPPPRVLVLLPPEPNGFETIVTELEEQLTLRGFVIERFYDTTDAAVLAGTADAPQPPICVVAVGSEATRVAIERLPLPTVFGQVPDLEFAAADAYGVATMPPPALQLAAWKEVNPALRRVALILSADEYLLAAQARQAADAAGIELALRTATSDREALYLFRRMAGDVDGLWLLPDNAIMSPRAIREMLEHANARGVQSLAFTPALLEWGASISVSGTPQNVAATLADVVERIDAGGADELPAVTPLSELEIRLHPEVRKRRGSSAPDSAWIVRDGSG